MKTGNIGRNYYVDLILRDGTITIKTTALVETEEELQDYIRGLKEYYGLDDVIIVKRYRN